MWTRTKSDGGGFEIKDWMVGAIVLLGTVMIAWGVLENTVGTLKVDVTEIKTWKDSAIEKMGNMDGKLDALLIANGVTYTPKPNGGKHQ